MPVPGDTLDYDLSLVSDSLNEYVKGHVESLSLLQVWPTGNAALCYSRY